MRRVSLRLQRWRLCGLVWHFAKAICFARLRLIVLWLSAELRDKVESHGFVWKGRWGSGEEKRGSVGGQSVAVEYLSCQVEIDIVLVYFPQGSRVLCM